VTLNKNIAWDSLPEFGLVGDTATNFSEDHCNSLCTWYDVSYGALQFEKRSESSVYGKGLGQLEYSIFDDVGGANGGSGWHVRYFKKGTNICGSKMYNSIENQSHLKNELLSSIYPNPTNGIIHLPSNLVGFEYKLLDLKGKQEASGTTTNIIKLSDMPAGIYFLQIQKDTQFLTNKLVIR
jgi:hypothetical protein